MSNLSGEPLTDNRMLFCTRHWSGDNNQENSYLLHFYKVVVPLYILLATTTTLGNSLILVALQKESSLHPPSKLLLRSLAVTDLCVGVIAQPISITLVLSALHENWDLCRVAKYSVYVVTVICSGVSLAVLSAISVDRLLALLLGLRYRQVVTVKRVRVVVFLCWLKSCIVGTLYVWSLDAFFIVSGVLILVEIFVTTYSYTRIFHTIRRQQSQVQDTLGTGPKRNTGPNMGRYKKTVFNALWVHLTLMTCYVPFAVVTTVIAIRGLRTSLFLAEGIAVSFVYLNSSMNPVLYCWKIKEVRQAVKETVRHFFACLSI